MPELRVLEMGGNNFVELEELDFTPLSSLQEFITGENTLKGTKKVIMEGMEKMKNITLGSCSLEGCRSLYMDTPNLRALIFGDRSFRSLDNENLKMVGRDLNGIRNIMIIMMI